METACISIVYDISKVQVHFVDWLFFRVSRMTLNEGSLPVPHWMSPVLQVPSSGMPNDRSQYGSRRERGSLLEDKMLLLLKRF